MKFNTQSPTPAASHGARRNEAWAIDFAKLDLDRRPLVVMVIDVYTRRPLSATVTLSIAEDIAAGLGRLVRRSGCPHEIRIDHGFDQLCGFKDWRNYSGLGPAAPRHR